MENRDINNRPPPSNALSLYASGISSLRLQASDLADEILSKPASYWNSNPKEASGVLSRIEHIELSESLLDTYKDIQFFPDE